MRSRILSFPVPVLVLLLVMLLMGGCGDSTQPPTAISLDQIPAELEKAFASAKGETKGLSDQAVAAVQSKEFPKAATALDALARSSDLSKTQGRTVAGARMTINALLLEAESKGDPRAVETLDFRRRTK